MIELDAETPLQKIEYGLYPWVTLVIMPLIALANAGMLINSTFFTALLDPVSLGVAIGLLLGKFVGFIYMVDGEVRNCGFTTICHMEAYNRSRYTCRAGFTMSLFVTGLAISDPEMIDQSKYGILISSIIADCLEV